MKKGGYPYLAILSSSKTQGAWADTKMLDLNINFMNLADFSRYFTILGVRRKIISLPEVLKNGF